MRDDVFASKNSRKHIFRQVQNEGKRERRDPFISVRHRFTAELKANGIVAVEGIAQKMLMNG